MVCSEYAGGSSHASGLENGEQATPLDSLTHARTSVQACPAAHRCCLVWLIFLLDTSYRLGVETGPAGACLLVRPRAICISKHQLHYTLRPKVQRQCGGGRDSRQV
jgi:hypothetical protein